SSEIYGDPDPAAIPTPETYRGIVSCTGPRACYDESKRLGETLCVTFWQQFGTPVKIIRPFNVYGPGQRLDDKRIIPDLLSAALQRQPIVLHSDGRATRSFCYATDFLSGMLHVLMSNESGEAFNVGNDEEVTIRQVAEVASRLDASGALPIEFRVSGDSQYLVDNPQRRCPDLSKMRQAFPWQPCVPVAEGLARAYRSYLAETSVPSPHRHLQGAGV
ncbi:MAG TPA: NAD-dependent epimerase/dehydratase family protein, partial [Pirellulales bacterium]|nr:NAD-dependent epimerase/dehydratase family protein [Pirellulales bacterium]